MLYREAHPTRIFIVIIILMIALAVLLSLRTLHTLLPCSLWWQAFTTPAPGDIRQWVIHDSFLPRLAISLLGGALLATAGLFFQHALRNPFAEPTTLGVSAGASLAMLAGSMGMPALAFSRLQGLAFLGGMAALLVVTAMAYRRKLSPLTLILAGLVVNLYCGALSTLLGLLNHEAMQSLYIWSSGSLNQNNGTHVRALLLPLVIGGVGSLLLWRPLLAMTLSDEVQKNTGFRIIRLRFIVLFIAVLLSSALVATVGMIGFLGFLAPTFCKLLGVNSLPHRLFYAPLFGAVTLWLTDQLMQNVVFLSIFPTGILVSFIGALALLILLPRLKDRLTVSEKSLYLNASPLRHLRFWLAALFLLLVAGFVVGLCFNRGADGWLWQNGETLSRALAWRLPRTVAAMCAGMLLAAAGAILQRMTGNSMASPEVLGVTSGSACGVLIVAFLPWVATPPMMLLAAAAGALLTLTILMAVARKSHYNAERILLVGVVISTLFSALISFFIAGGNGRVIALLPWLAGSTWAVTIKQSLGSLFATLGLLVLLPLCYRSLTILPLGNDVGHSLGVPLAARRRSLLVLAAVMTGCATLSAGPLSFVGLLAPHLARMIGLRSVQHHLAGSVFIGAMVMLLADWLARNLLYPYEIPAGLMATLLGGGYFILLLIMRRE